MVNELVKTENPELIKAVLQDSEIQLKQHPVKDISLAINSNDITLNKIKLTAGSYNAKLAILKLIKDIKDLSNKNPERVISEKQAYLLAEDILQHYYFMKIAEIKYCFMQGYKNQYKTKIFDTLEVNHFTDWLAEYDAERVEYIVNNPDHKVKLGLKQLPELTLSEAEMEANKQRLKELTEKLQRENYEYNKKLSEEKQKFYINLYEYCNAYNIPDHSEIMDCLETQLSKNWQTPTLQNVFIDTDGNPDYDRYTKHIHLKILNRVNDIKPKTHDDIMRICYYYSTR